MESKLQNSFAVSVSALLLFGAIACGGNQTPESKKGLAKNEEKFLGNMISNEIPDDYDTYWNALTLENASKWGSVESFRNTMVWTKVDEAYQYALSRHMPFNQHSLLWGSQQPAWINGLNAADQVPEIEDWMRLFCERYPHTNLLTVANEPINSPPLYAKALGGDGESGADWLVWAYEKAREHCPLQKLIISEYGVITDATLRSQYLEYIDILNSKNLLDGIGIEGAALNRQNVNASQLLAALDELASRGLPIYLTQMYITNDDLEVQKNLYAELFPVVWEHPAVAGVTLWGYRYQYTFENSDLLIENNRPSPAMEWLMHYFDLRAP
jgi:endo-1,4-beta-xylanase